MSTAGASHSIRKEVANMLTIVDQLRCRRCQIGRSYTKLWKLVSTIIHFGCSVQAGLVRLLVVVGGDFTRVYRDSSFTKIITCLCILYVGFDFAKWVRLLSCCAFVGFSVTFLVVF